MKRNLCILPFFAFFFLYSILLSAQKKSDEEWRDKESQRQFVKITEDADLVAGNSKNLADHFFCTDEFEKTIYYTGEQSSNRWNIFMKALGQEMQGSPVTEGKFKITDPCISPYQGEILAYCDRKDFNWGIFTCKPNDPTSVKLMTNNLGSCSNAVFSPVKKEFVFCIKGKKDLMSLWTFNMSGDQATFVAKGYSPCYFPEGNRLLFVRDNKKNKQTEVLVYDFDLNKEMSLLSGPLKSIQQPAVSPNGRYIAYTSRAKFPHMPENCNIFVYDLQNQENIQLTFSPADDLNPVWSADGNSLYILSSRESKGKKYNIWKLNVW